MVFLKKTSMLNYLKNVLFLTVKTKSTNFKKLLVD